MKKVYLLAAAAAMISFTSCSKKDKNAEAECEVGEELLDEMSVVADDDDCDEDDEINAEDLSLDEAMEIIKNAEDLDGADLEELQGLLEGIED